MSTRSPDLKAADAVVDDLEQQIKELRAFSDQQGREWSELKRTNDDLKWKIGNLELDLKNENAKYRSVLERFNQLRRVMDYWICLGIDMEG